ncbi:polyvinylalcohol dehydrogenase [Nocardioides sp. GY 10113]|uniref:outer membrane protein assembly factor BamB family protein n=1 Tax=Nocardioides sp. GY 10113 TaxID=2569761 RepID=UPI0010A93BDC|nr:PQQ-binding-like beta-propeller repeat protein [Nocardioides sp. GY 10113]TIC87544.1 polyvinylalcohol dehydrogenase [Nocardioides sp. GY 10113]
MALTRWTRWTRTQRMLLAAVAAGTLVIAGQVAAGAAPPGGSGWSSAGGDRQNTRSAKTESKISPATVGDLGVSWVLTTGGDVSATPAVDGERVYVPDWAGNLYAVDRRTGAVDWTRTIADYTGVAGDKARATPAIAGDLLVLGTQGGTTGGGGNMLAIDKDTGDLVWSTQLDDHPAAIITQSATVFDGVVYVGVASNEEGRALIPGYDCCSFRGSMSALDLDTGVILWKTYTAPEGFPGNAVWGSSPAIDVKRGSVYIATGNNYDVPDDVLACVEAAGDDPDAKQACLPADNHFDSVLSLDMRTGEIKWATRALPYDAWTVDCIPFFGDGDNCPEPAGPDYDFGQAPALFKASSGDGPARELVGAGQKSGQYWALDPDTGQVVWVTQAGPGGTAGGLQWGSAVDGQRVYTANANSGAVPWTLPDGSTTASGVWSGLDASTGLVEWQTAPPNGGGASGPVTTANGVVFGCALDAAGYMYAMDAATGDVLWSFASGGSCLSGAAISNGSVFWGSGYSNLGLGTPNNQLYAFSLQ